MADDSAERRPRGSAREVFLAFIVLGCTSFGGPVAHLGYFRSAFVDRRQWLSEKAYADLIALCQFLPGPASSQVGMAIGLQRAGYGGMAAAWLGFTLPSALAMMLFAYATGVLSGFDTGWIAGLKAAAVAVVAQALHGMARSLTPDAVRASIALFSLILVVLIPGPTGQVLGIIAGGVLGLFVLRKHDIKAEKDDAMPKVVTRSVALSCLALFFILLMILPLIASVSATSSMLDSFYRAGALVFGGGHVVLPLLEAEMVGSGLVSRDLFLAGYGGAQAVPGPLFTFASYLGAAAETPPNGWLGALVATLGIFLPSALLVIGVFPFWDGLRRKPKAQHALMGVNAAVVGLLGTAFYDPVLVAGLPDARAMALGAASFVALMLWKLPPWLVVVSAGLLGAIIL